MTYIEFFKKMQEGKLVSADWRNILDLINTEYTAAEKDDYLKILILYFSLIDEENVYMMLDEKELSEKFKKKIDGLKIELKEDDTEKENFYSGLYDDIKTVITGCSRLKNFTDVISSDGKEKLFVIEDGKLYTRKHFNAVKSILDSANRLFVANSPKTTSFDYTKYVDSGYKLTAGQEEILQKGMYNNLFITGGPGTGKTTSIFFLLLSLLLENPDFTVYLTAPAGKAASRMKDSIINSAGALTSSLDIDTVNRIKELSEYTIHRLLNYDPQKNEFNHNKSSRFPENSVFVIDEASMIDVNLYAEFFEAIPDKARVFVLGDKNQLPSVECGAVFGNLFERFISDENKVSLKESKRFGLDSDIYKLSEAVNKGCDLTGITGEWKDWHDFAIDKNGVDLINGGSLGTTPIYYYKDEALKQSEMIESLAQKWYRSFYEIEGNKLQDICNEISINAGEAALSNEELKKIFDNIWSVSENARILCACNKNVRGIQHINNYILKQFYSKKKTISGFYPGELLIITKNNKSIDLFNGDCGVTVKFNGDDTLYLMLKKATELCLDDKKIENRIFKIGDYLFYPVRMISMDEISPAFAITVHKSQGSDYNNILVILPKLKGHPLLNRQIIYTAITRTKYSTYILANQENLQYAANNVPVRDTF